MEREYVVEYSVPVCCHVTVDDDGTAAVTRIVVVDEEVKPTGNYYRFPIENLSDRLPLDLPNNILRAAEIQEWPAWELGY